MIVIGKLVAQKPVTLNWRKAAWTWKFSELFNNNHGIIAEVFGIADRRVVPTLRPLAELTGGGYRLWWPKWTWPVTLGQENLTVFEPKPGKEGPGAQCGSISFRLCSLKLQADWIIETHVRVLDWVVLTLRLLAELKGGGRDGRIPLFSDIRILGYLGYWFFLDSWISGYLDIMDILDTWILGYMDISFFHYPYFGYPIRVSGYFWILF